jgi:hypothetical protein
MPRPRERRWPSIALGYALLLLVLSGVTAFLYESVAPAGQLIVVRLAVAVLLAVILLHIRRYFRGDPLWDPPSEFENALGRERLTAKLDPSLLKLREELNDAERSRNYFDRVLWPRLKAIAASNYPVGEKIEPPSRARFAWRGPSLATLVALVDRLEQRK